MEENAGPASSIEQIPLQKIFKSPHQMRKTFDPIALRDLARSMKREGLIQPITLRKVGEAYELVVGERRLRAAQAIGWTTIDARVIDISDEEAAIKGLIENLQRADLSAIEEAGGYKQLAEPPYSLTQEAIAERVGKSQTAVARSLALLELPLEIQEIMPRGAITETHTRSLRKITDRAKQIELTRQADREGWTVKELERQVHEILKESGKPIYRRELKPKTSPNDPLAKAWPPIMQTTKGREAKISSIRYQSFGKWTLQIETGDASDPRRALTELFIHLTKTLNDQSLSDEPAAIAQTESNKS